MPEKPKKTTTRTKKLKDVEKLLERPEVSKLQKLDQELTAVSADTSVPAEQRIKEYEELMASYNEVVKRLQKYGSTSILTERSADEGDGQENTTRTKLESMLKNEGVKIEKDRVQVPLKKDDDVDNKRRKRSTVSYSRKTFDKVLDFILSAAWPYGRHVVRQVARQLFFLVRDKIDDFSQYPGFADILRTTSATFNGIWTRL